MFSPKFISAIAAKAGRIMTFTHVSHQARCFGLSSTRVNGNTSVTTNNLRSHTPHISTLIDPVSSSKPSYIIPALRTNFDKFIFGVPLSIPPTMKDPEPPKPLISDPEAPKNTKIEAHKRDKYWKRRGMKHHRYLRWRKRNETMLAYRETARQEKRARFRAEEIANIWKEAGLESEPPELDEKQQKTLVLEWKERGIWTEALTPQEIYQFATPPEPPNKKTLPPHHVFVPK